MPTYLTPGVYVEEISALPPSVAEVATAVPAFLGYTQVNDEVVRIATLLEYQQNFGPAQPTTFTVEVTTNQQTGAVSVTTTPGGGASQPASLLPYAVRHHFANGGGPCYIVPVGRYG